MLRIHAVCMTQNEQLDLVENITRVLPYVSTVTIIDGGSTDGTIPYVRNWARQMAEKTRQDGWPALPEHRLRLFIHPWKDNFPEQRNNYLRRVAEIAQPGDWILAFDPDELIEEDSLEALGPVAAWAAERGYGRVGFRCNSVSLRGPEVANVSKDDYYKRLLIRWSPDLYYTHHNDGPVHEHLEGVLGPDLDPGYAGIGPVDCPFEELVYVHRKQENITHWRGMRNAFCGGGGPNLGHANPFWVELRTWCAANLDIPFEPGTRAGWASFLSYLIAGNVDPWLKNWMIAHRHDTWKEYDWTIDGDGSSEFREFYKTFFRMLHPEEEPEELRGEYIP